MTHCGYGYFKIRLHDPANNERRGRTEPLMEKPLKCDSSRAAPANEAPLLRVGAAALEGVKSNGSGPGNAESKFRCAKYEEKSLNYEVLIFNFP